MRIVSVHVDFVFSGNEDFVGSAVTESYVRRGETRRSYKVGPFYGRVLPSGSYQLYEMGHGTMTKVRGVVKAPEVDFSKAIFKDDLPRPTES